MTGSEIFFLVFAVVGGLALFIFGMNIMTDGLREAAGSGLRILLARATSSRLRGLALGTVMGTLVHSSATTVMLVGFINAGLMTLEQSVPAMLGANIGTTLSMQAISFKLTDYCFVAIAIGFILHLAAPQLKAKACGRALIGFGLLFLGMSTMSDAIKPHREILSPLLVSVDGSTIEGLLRGVALATALTAVWQSSGATIAIIFALITAGVFTRLEQVYPIVLGAHIGTCATALLGSIGTNIEARRGAVSHLLFNIGNVVMAILLRDYFIRALPYTSTDLIRQTANLHTGVMVMAAFAVLPLSVVHAKLTRLVAYSRKPRPEPSHLDMTLQEYPEKAIVACIQELRRVALICQRNFHLAAKVLLLDMRRSTVQKIKKNEEVVNEIKTAMLDYLASLTTHYLSRRQTILLQHLSRCMADIERVGDHIDELCDLSIKRAREPKAKFDRETIEHLFDIYAKADRVLTLTVESLEPARKHFQKTAEAILKARNEYVADSMEVKSVMARKVVERSVTPIGAMFFSQYVNAFDRIVRHSKTIALAQQQPDFWVKRKKLERMAPDAPDYEPPAKVDPKDFLDRLQLEDYL